jgi:LPS sulfotransferase NodH
MQDRGVDMEIQSSYLICSSPRTGSNLLATTIRNTHIAGYPFEYFSQFMLNEPFMLETIGLRVEEAGPAHLPSRLDRILASGTTPNGIFGATMHWGHLRTLLDAISEMRGREITPQNGGLDALFAFFPALRFVRLYRQNEVAQGISHYVAKATSRWQEQGPDPVRDLSADQQPDYDFSAIRKFVNLARHHEKAWRDLLARSSDVTLSLSYEELAADHEAAVSRVLGFVGMPGTETAIPSAPFRRQANARSFEWEQRFRAEEAAVMLDREAALVA